MTQRMEIGTIFPDAYKAMAGLEKVIGKSGLPNAWNRIGVINHMTPESFK